MAYIDRTYDPFVGPIEATIILLIIGKLKDILFQRIRDI